jgi:bifunctional non-homologous end joining protein LigD
MAAQRKPGDKAPYPGFVEPALATDVGRVPNGARWSHEIKFDGYRVQVHLKDAVVKVYTRRGNDWTNRFKKIAADAWHVSAGSAIIDGEVVVPAADGTTDFSVLQNELKGRSSKIVLVAFDLLYLNGHDLRKLPLFERKTLLKKIVSGTDIQFSESFEFDGREMYEHACGVGLEGVVSKVRDSRYPTGRTRNWVKVTCAQRETLPIAGFALDGNKLDGIYVGRRKGGQLIYAGKVDHGFTAQSEKELRARLKPLIRKTQPYAKKIAHRGIWVEPSLLAEIEYRAKSAEGKLRHPFFKGIREDL